MTRLKTADTAPRPHKGSPIKVLGHSRSIVIRTACHKSFSYLQIGAWTDGAARLMGIDRGAEIIPELRPRPIGGFDERNTSGGRRQVG